VSNRFRAIAEEVANEVCAKFPIEYEMEKGFNGSKITSVEFIMPYYAVVKATDGVVMCPVCFSTETYHSIVMKEAQINYNDDNIHLNRTYTYTMFSSDRKTDIDINICNTCGNIYYPLKLKKIIRKRRIKIENH
jgi:hypothetical protein